MPRKEPDASVWRCKECGTWTWRGECSTCGTDESLDEYPPDVIHRRQLGSSL